MFLVGMMLGHSLESFSLTNDPVQKETLEQREERMKWFRDARFGMFIHWGPYSALGGEYHGKPVGWIAEWIQHTARIPMKEYSDDARSFKPVKFDAHEWVSIARNAGMKYIAITSKHHDGFCMWDTHLTDYNIVHWGGFGRDPIAELSKECRKQGLRFGIYYSVRDWHHPDWALRYAHLNKPNSGWGYAASPWTKEHVAQCGCPSCRKDMPITPEMDTRPIESADMNRYLDYMKGQLTEIITQYHPSLMWFDAQDIQDPKLGRVQEMVDTMRKLDPSLIINDRVGPDNTMWGDYGVNEGSVPGSGSAREWETCMTLNNTWGYSRFDQHWKPAAELLHTLVETTSKNGNFLLNVGPDGEGVIPAGSVEKLKEVGQWMAVNHESIYGCQSYGVSEPKWGRMTSKGKSIYLHVFFVPEEGRLTLAKPPGWDGKAFMLADAKKHPLFLNCRGDELVIQLDKQFSNPMDTVVVLEP